MGWWRQTWTLTRKNFLIAFWRRPFSTILRAFLLPVVIVIFLAYVRDLFDPPSKYGIGSPRPVRSVIEAMGEDEAARNTLVFVRNGLRGGDVDRVIERVADPVRRGGKTVRVLETPGELLDVCPSSLREVTPCFGAAVFYSSPNEGPGGIWNYTLRADASLGWRINTDNADNDVQIYTIPLQHAIDFAIASLNTTIDASALPAEVLEYPYTSRTREQRSDDIRIIYMKALVNWLAVAYIVGMLGIVYQMVGVIASEREMGMSALIESMMPNLRRWQPQAARLISYHLAFDVLYLPGWIIIGAILAWGIFEKSNKAIIIIFHVLAGLSLSSFSILGAAYFKKAQLSGIATSIAVVLLAILAQITSKGGAGEVIILGLLFPPVTYVYFLIFMARWESQNRAIDLLKEAPNTNWTIPGLVLWIFFLLQIFIYPALGALVERQRYAAASKGRTFTRHPNDPTPVRIQGFSKHYQAPFFARVLGALFSKPREVVKAVNGLDLSIPRGQIMVLLGANGSGKTTTLETVAGLNAVTEGSIEVDGTGGLGLCPQRNVLWESLTVVEHVTIFNRLKTTSRKDSPEEIRQLIAACDLGHKIKAQSKTLSGGQQRKLQLAMMFTGGSQVCCVDEVSSGLDPLSRRKIWDILLRERGARTIMLTTHFLDEADLLADYIAILSKGTLRAQGSAVELKNRLGGGYRVHIGHQAGVSVSPDAQYITSKHSLKDQDVYTVETSTDAARLLGDLERRGVEDYQVAGPSIEDVFLKLAEEVNEAENEKALDGNGSSVKTGQGLQLLPGKRISMPQQAWVLFRKRITILRRNFLPYAAALLLPIIATALVTLLLDDFKQPSCSPAENTEDTDVSSIVNQLTGGNLLNLTIGPPSRVSIEMLSNLQGLLPESVPLSSLSSSLSSLAQTVRQVDSLQAFRDDINQRFANITPGGFFIPEGTAGPTFAYKANLAMQYAIVTQNLLDRLVTNISISTQFATFNSILPPDLGDSLQAITYFGLAMASYPAFFALYPTIERIRNVRALHFSNGVRALPLWFAYLMFDFCFVLAISAISVIIFAASSSAWYHIGYLFVVFMLYGLASTTLSYIISLKAKSQLSAYAICSAFQSVIFLVYFFVYMRVQAFAPVDDVESQSNLVHFCLAILAPITSLTRSMFVAFNLFYLDCENRQLKSYPGELTLYGGPILYLLIQTILLFAFLVWMDKGPTSLLFRRKYRNPDEEEEEMKEKEVRDELSRVNSSSNGLRVLHLTKAFKRNVAVQDVTFGVARGEVFALLGPNGAGKSTTISMIRGEILPSNKEGEILVEDLSIRRQKVAARSRMGVCPQFDAVDQMTAIEHLRFYARVRGVADVEHNVREVIQAVGLQSFSTRTAAKLSGGNKRKLSLAIALLGNPSVLLLDEPSSGMDAASKRVMWKTLAAVAPDRSILLTTHSMEEADALANRAGIMATRMLALGTTDYLRQKYGDAYHVHLITKTAPHTSTEEMERIRAWVSMNFAGAEIEAKTYHGQLRFSIPARAHVNGVQHKSYAADGSIEHHAPATPRSSISALFNLLETHKHELGLEYYSVSHTTLDQVFLTIIGKHNVSEEQQTPTVSFFQRLRNKNKSSATK
ncbi:MAG: hypothetical protein M1823_000818 [Watsoniomyces obsoletus]|nr:MAG: hypothetical protein M1823_000818 [Watsoniomyces obsoletus]